MSAANVKCFRKMWRNRRIFHKYIFYDIISLCRHLTRGIFNITAKYRGLHYDRPPKKSPNNPNAIWIVVYRIVWYSLKQQRVSISRNGNFCRPQGMLLCARLRLLVPRKIIMNRYLCRNTLRAHPTFPNFTLGFLTTLENCIALLLRSTLGTRSSI